jgi:hypothetical protein
MLEAAQVPDSAKSFLFYEFQQSKPLGYMEGVLHRGLPCDVVLSRLRALAAK